MNRRSFLTVVSGGAVGVELAMLSQPQAQPRELVPVYKMMDGKRKQCRMSELVVGDDAMVGAVRGIVTHVPEQLPDGVWSVRIDA